MKLTFKEIVNREIAKEYEDWIGDNMEIRKYKDGSIEIEDECPSCVMSITNNELFALVKEEVSLNEALEALEEGKEIESVASGFKYCKVEGIINVLNSVNCVIDAYSESTAWFRIDEIKGKWYIND